MAMVSGIASKWHTQYLFEKDKHFSHLSTLERNMAFRKVFREFPPKNKIGNLKKKLSQIGNGPLLFLLSEYDGCQNLVGRF